ncbi:MAG: Ig-like domain-containing protein [Thermoleophilia bacterium]
MTNKDIAKADGKDAIDITFQSSIHGSTDGIYYYRIVISGSGNTVSPEIMQESVREGFASYSPSNHFTLSSNTPEQKTISVQRSTDRSQWISFPLCGASATTLGDLTIKATFTDPNPKPQSGSVGKSTPSNTPESSSMPIPSLEKIKIGADVIMADKLGSKSINTRSDLTFSGKTIANSKITLFFHSDPFEETTTADKNGDWSYRLKAGKLSPGDHTIQIAVTDPATNQTSTKSNPLKFNVVNAIETASANKNDNFFSKYMMYIISGLLLTVSATFTLAYIIVRKRKQSKTLETENAGINLEP